MATAILTTVFNLGYQMDTNTIIVFCRGYSHAMGTISRDYHGILEMWHSTTVLAIWSFVTVVPFVELGIYFNLYKHLNNNDQEIEQRGVLPKEVISQRRRKNIITLSGQAFAFCIEAGFGFIVSMMNLIPDDILDASLHPILAIAFSSANAFAHFWGFF